MSAREATETPAQRRVRLWERAVELGDVEGVTAEAVDSARAALADVAARWSEAACSGRGKPAFADLLSGDQHDELAAASALERTALAAHAQAKADASAARAAYERALEQDIAERIARERADLAGRLAPGTKDWAKPLPHTADAPRPGCICNGCRPVRT